jgi:hypothetical protein
MANTQKTFATVLGIVLLVVGLAGLAGGLGIVGSDGIFGTNTLQDVLHVIAGVWGIWIGTKGMGAGYNKVIGWIAILLAVLGFAAKDLMMTYLGADMSIAYLHAVIGIVALLVYHKGSR